MDRVFRKRFTLGTMIGMLLFSLMAFYFFWVRYVVPGLIVVFLFLLLMDRSLYTLYRFVRLEDKDVLVIEQGRFSRKRIICVADITACRKMIGNFGLSHYLLITYGLDHVVSIEPENEMAFISEIKKRQ